MERGGRGASPEGRTFHISFCCFPTKWQAVFFLLRLAGRGLSAGVLVSWKQDVEKAIAGGGIRHDPVRSCI